MPEAERSEISYHQKQMRAVYDESREYLSKGTSLGEFDLLVSALDALSDLVPADIRSLAAGLSMPMSEAHFEFQNSFELALLGLYRHALLTLRLVLELGVLGVFLDATDSPESKWYFGQAPTPPFKRMLKDLNQVPGLVEFDRRFGLVSRVAELYQALGGFVHTRDFAHSALGLSGSNFPRFVVEPLERYIATARQSVQLISSLTLLKYPLGMQVLPFFDKWGVDGPLGGYIDEGQVLLLGRTLPEDERDYLQSRSDLDPVVQAIRREILAMPDLTPEQLDQQFRVQRERFKVPPRARDAIA
ncbi:MAG: hypothetical protein KGJ86_09060 [Chloroflexota bacterium]|nr:hypothetical protein [Chloroflexota bacterium]